MKIQIRNGYVIDPKNRINSCQNVLIEDGVVKNISKENFPADEIIDASNRIICPGFVDIHIHEAPYNEEKQAFDGGIFDCMLRMGVTTCIGGNCGIGPENPSDYLDAVDKHGVPVNVGMLIPHESLRANVGENEKYKHAKPENIKKMKNLATDFLAKGALGLSFGVRYVPGTTEDELHAICSTVKSEQKIIASHIRNDAAYVFDAAREFIDIGKQVDVPVQISHIGSMAAFGQMNEFLSLIDSYRVSGVDVWCDCYPYNAFSTGIGETTYDTGFLQRYKTTYDKIEIAEGKYKGQRATKAIFDELRREAPETITIAHLMNNAEIEQAILHPGVIIASDGFMHNMEGHPRASGTFPRALHSYVTAGRRISLFEMIEKMTWLPAQRLNINKGNLSVGSDADIVIFDSKYIKDNATFELPALPPDGIEYVLIKGKIAAKNNEIIQNNVGKSIRR